MLDINMEYRRGVLFVRFIGILNYFTSYNLIDTLLPIILHHGIRNLVYNFSFLSSIDEVGNKSLLLGYNAILNNKGNVLVIDNKFNLEDFKETKNELTALEILKD